MAKKNRQQITRDRPRPRQEGITATPPPAVRKDQPRGRLGGRRLLGPAPVFPGAALAEDEYQRLMTDFYLHSGAVRVLLVLRGEPDGKGGLAATPGRYTLFTKGGPTPPPLQVRTGTGV